MRFDYLDGIMVGCLVVTLAARLIGEMSTFSAALVLGCFAAYLLIRYVEMRWRA